MAVHRSTLPWWLAHFFSRALRCVPISHTRCDSIKIDDEVTICCIKSKSLLNVTIRFPLSSIPANRKRFSFKWAPRNSLTLYQRLASSRKKGAMIHLKPCFYTRLIRIEIDTLSATPATSQNFDRRCGGNCFRKSAMRSFDFLETQVQFPHP